jgi:uncharacterized membrane protein SirB2
MSYEFYKVTHIAFAFMFLASLTMSYSLGKAHKVSRILAMVASFLLFVAGFGLMARLQIKTWPLWIQCKLGIWAILAVAWPILSKRTRIAGHYLIVGAVLLMSVAAWLAVTKPV